MLFRAGKRQTVIQAEAGQATSTDLGQFCWAELQRHTFSQIRHLEEGAWAVDGSNRFPVRSYLLSFQ